jgi:uncharacterized membrane protein
MDAHAPDEGQRRRKLKRTIARMPAPPRTRARPLHPVAFMRALRARPRLVICTVIGILVAAMAPLGHSSVSAMVLVGWNTGALLYLVLVWRMIRGTDACDVQERALAQDEGRLAILLLVVAAALAVLLAVGTQLAQVKDLHGTARALHLGLAALTVFTSWLFTQVLFALHYAHDFYAARIHGGPDPLLFPGTPDPAYGDFVHFACVIGTAAQTADISFNGSGMRAVGTLHCILAFFFNASLLALSINLAAGLLL